MELPDSLSPIADAPVWVAWDGSSGRKVPKSPSGGNARSNDPATWGTYAEAQAAAEKGRYTGVGVMLTDGLVGIDMDGVVGEDGRFEPWAQAIVDAIGSYAELSPSGRGVHIIARADPEVVGAIGRADHARGLEVYNHGRYFTVTGDVIKDSPVADATSQVADLLAEYFPGESGEDRLRKAVGRMARDQVSRRANQTMRHNASRDGIRWARVPMGGETCTFCAMLASRGFVYRSAKTAGQGDHWHRSCRCKVVPETAGTVEGYDPDEWLGRWQAMRDIDADPRLTAAQKIEAKGRVAKPAEPNPQPSAPTVPTPKPVALAGRLGGFNARTGGMTPDEYAEYRRELQQVESLEGIRLGRSEYARVISEINTHMSDEDRKHALVSKPIGNYRYTFINKGFDDYVFVDKVEID